MSSETLPNRSAPIPVTVISGFLGAGKTTLVNHWLRHPRGQKFVVLVNDFGELPIDVDLIESVDGDTINLANGCACCSMGGDLFNAFVNVLDRRPAPDHLIIEASGVADPVRIANFARAEPDLDLNAILSIVDVENIKDLTESERLSATVTGQIRASDLVILNKLDLINQQQFAEVETMIDEISPHTTQLPTRQSKVPLDLILNLDKSAQPGAKTEPLSDTHGEKYQKWSKKFDQPLDRKLFEKALGKLTKNVLRLKGIVCFQDDQELYIVQWVLGRYTITALGDRVPQAGFSSRMIAIGLESDFVKTHLDHLFDL